MRKIITLTYLSLFLASCGITTGPSLISQPVVLPTPTPTATPAPSPTPVFVGSCYGGGVVFYVNTIPNAAVGNQGLVAALNDVSASTYAWDTSGTLTLAGTSLSLFTGASNTTLLLATADGLAGNMQAASMAHAYTDGTYNDWYLPSQGEIALLKAQAGTTSNLFTNCSGTNPLSASVYWSSSQYDTGDASYVSFSNGVVYVGPLSTSYSVRAIRAY